MVGAELRAPLVGGGTARAVNLDYAASAPALAAVADHLAEVLPHYASVHRGAGYRSQLSTAVYEHARIIVGEHFGARADDIVVFTRNTTDALNLLAGVVPGETVLLDIEHHANLLPWVDAGARVVRSELGFDATFEALERELRQAPAALLTVTGASNVTGELLPIARFAELAHRHGARLAVDAAQLAPHRRVDLSGLGIDYLAFSAHKAYAPYGAGALIGRADWLDAGRPHLRGGGAVSTVSIDRAEWRAGPQRHEAGTPNVLGVAALARALQELDAIGWERVAAHEAALRDRLLAGLAELPRVRVLQIFPELDEAVGVVGFAVEGIDAGLLAAALSAEWGIGVRHGLFCAHPVARRLGGDRALLRASIGLGSSAEDVDALLGALDALLADGPREAYRLVDGQWEPAEDDRPRPEWAPRLQGEAAAFGCAV